MDKDETAEISEQDPSNSVTGEINRSAVAIAELFEVAAHLILYLRSVYPPDLFLRCRKWDLPVFQCKEGAVQEYLSEVTKSIAEELNEDNLDKIGLVIHENGALHERFVWLIERQDQNGPDIVSDGLEMVGEEGWRQQFGTLIRKLTVVDLYLRPPKLSSNLTFSIVLELRDAEKLDLTEWSMNLPETPETSFDNELYDIVHIVDLGSIHLKLSVSERQEKDVEDTDSS